MKRWEGLADRFMAVYQARGLSHGTAQAMRREWDRWGIWLKQRRPQLQLEDVSVESITAYISDYGVFRSKSTQYSMLSRMRQIGRFLVAEAIWPNNPLQWMHGPRLDRRHRLPRRIESSALEKMWEAAATHRYEFQRYLWVAILGVFYGTGIRRDELVRLSLTDWDRESSTLLIHGNKSRRQRRVPLPPLACGCLEAYLPHRQSRLDTGGMPGESALFVNSYGSRITLTGVSQGIGVITRRASVKITLHQFRHTCASDLLAEGVKLPHVQQLLGHRSISTTMRYLHITDPELHKAVGCHPLTHLGSILRSTSHVAQARREVMTKRPTRAGDRHQPKAALDPLMENYLDYMRTVERRAGGTIKDIRCTLGRVMREMNRLVPGKPLWELRLTDFLRFLEQQRGRGYSSVGLCKNVSHLRGFLNYAWRVGRSDRNVLADFFPEYRCAKKEPESLSIDEALRLIQACPTATATERRDRVMILLLYGCGLRTSEVCKLKVQDISVTRRELHVKHAKGDIERIVPIPEVVYTELLAYLHERGRKRGPLFLSEAKRRPIRLHTVGEAVRRAAEQAGIERWVTPKMLRHSYATHLMDRGVDLAVISKLMGHSGPAESGVYLHVLAGRKESAVARLDQ
jgi:integrase/recombinase XerD